MNHSCYRARYVRGCGWVPLDVLDSTIWLEDDPENLAYCSVQEWSASYSFFVDNLCAPGRSRYVSRIASTLPEPPSGGNTQVCKKHAWLRSTTPISREFAEMVAQFMPVFGLDNDLVLCARFYGMTCTGGPQDFGMDDACELYPEYWTTFQFDGSPLVPLIPVCESHLRTWQGEYEGMPCYAFYPIDPAPTSV